MISIKSKIAAGIIITIIFVLISVHGGKWANRVSAQHEQSMADAMSAMQGEK